VRIAVTGGAGFVGTKLLELMDSKRAEYISLDDAYGSTVLTHGKEIIPCSVFDANALDMAFCGADAVIHLVANSDNHICQQNPGKSFESNIHSLQVVLESCRRMGIKKIVFPSSAVVYGSTNEIPINENLSLHPEGVYAYHKTICEDLIKMYCKFFGIDYVILRIFNIYGKGVKGIFSRFLEVASNGEEYTAYGCSQYRDFVYMGDVVHALYQSAISDKANNKTINIGSGFGVQIRDILNIMASALPGAKWKEEKADIALYDHIADINRARLLLDYNPVSGNRGFLEYVIKKEICSL